VSTPAEVIIDNLEINSEDLKQSVERMQETGEILGEYGEMTHPALVGEIIRRFNAHEDLKESAHDLETEKHVLEAALYEVAEIVADSDLDATTQLAQLSLALSGIEQAGLIDGDKIGTDEQPEVSDEYL